MTSLAEEIKRLKARRGLTGGDPASLLGPELSRLCGLTGGEPPAEVRAKVVEVLHELAGDLPEDLRLAFLAGLGIHPEACAPVLERRLEWAAGHLHTSVRTVRRYVDQAIARVVDENRLPGPRRAGDHVPAGWWLSELRTALDLAGERPQALEEREIVAAREGLDRVVVSAHVPRHGARPGPPHGIELDVVSGARLIAGERPTATYFRHHLLLSRPLPLGGRHTLVLRLRVPPGQAMRPEYVFRPLRRCDRFRLSVSFGDRIPRRVWSVPGVPHGAVDDLPADPLPVGDDGRIAVGFTGLSPGLAYGLRWE